MTLMKLVFGLTVGLLVSTIVKLFTVVGLTLVTM